MSITVLPYSDHQGSHHTSQALLPELVMGHFFKTQPNPTQNFWTQPNPQKSSPDPTQPIIDTWYGILGYTENFIQQLLHVTDKFTVRSYAVLINRQWSISWRHAVKSQFSVKWHWYSDTFSCNFSVALYILCMLVLCSFHDFFCNFGILINEILH